MTQAQQLLYSYCYIKMRLTKNVMYSTSMYILRSILCCALFILLCRLELGNNPEFLCHKHLILYITPGRLELEISFIYWIPLISYHEN